MTFSLCFPNALHAKLRSGHVQNVLVSSWMFETRIFSLKEITFKCEIGSGGLK